MWGWIAASHAGDDLSVTSVGGDAVRAEAIDATDANALLSQRLRWSLGESARALVDARFALDPDAATTFEDSRVRELGVSATVGTTTWLVGRHAVVNGGPRLVDGLQGLAGLGASGEVSVGAWAGLVPDEFTTAPTLRFGAGPMFAFHRTTTSLSATGDLVVGTTGFERLGALILARGELGGRFQADARADLLLADALGNAGLSDGALWLRYKPARAARVDLFWNGYSSLRYQTRSALDPTVQRFAQRIEELGLAAGITQDVVDPTLHHLLGATVGGRGSGPVRPVGTLRARTLLHPDPLEQYSRLGALGGVAVDRLELDVDGNLLLVETGAGGDVGVVTIVEPVPEGPLAIDGSMRALFDPTYAGRLGWYADVFLDVSSAGGTAVAAGMGWSDEPADLLGDGAMGQDVGWSAFLRVQQYVRPGRAARPPSAVRSEAQPEGDSTVSTAETQASTSSPSG